MPQVRLDLDLAPQLVLDARLGQLRLDEYLQAAAASEARGRCIWA